MLNKISHQSFVKKLCETYPQAIIPTINCTIHIKTYPNSHTHTLTFRQQKYHKNPHCELYTYFISHEAIIYTPTTTKPLRHTDQNDGSFVRWTCEATKLKKKKKTNNFQQQKQLNIFYIPSAITP
jgi:hypothetical protein